MDDTEKNKGEKMVNPEQIKQAVIKGKYKEISKLVENTLKNGVKAMNILEEVLYPSMGTVGDKFSSGEYFIPDLILAAKAMQAAMDILKPYLVGKKTKQSGLVVMCTIEGDLHDVGKNLVNIMLEGSGFKVIDLGIDVKAQKFVEAVKKYKPQILGISGLLTTTLANVPKVLEALKKAGLREKVLVGVGGAPVTQDFVNRVGADLYAKDANQAAKVFTKAISKQRQSTQ